MDLPENTQSGLLANSVEGDNAPPLSVSELSGALKRTIESAFDHVRVRGEISGFKRHGSGHCYFTLKDEGACIDAVIWRGNAAGLAFRPEDGAEVIATGKLTTYAGRSKYQIVVDRLELAGEGALLALLEKRRRALAAEGLFEAARKRQIPFLPALIGVVTSPTGAVIRDILHRLSDRFPTRVILWPVPVQGEGASARIAAAIRGFALHVERPDLLIVARGGGSIEDLWAFNEEEVVRAAAESPIPLISAVGHETDTTLIDHAADRRAPTPTAAAEMAVPVLADLAAQLSEFSARSSHCVTRRVASHRERFELASGRWPEPSALFAPAAQRIDDLSERLPRALGMRAGYARGEYNAVAPRLRPQVLGDRVRLARDRLASLWRLAELAHPDKPLQRGFARVTGAGGEVISKAEDARRAGQVALHFADGEVPATINRGGDSIPPTGRVERKARRPYLAAQPGLFDAPDGD